MSINGVKIDLDYKNLYFVLKEKYDKLKLEIDELKLENKNKENELNKLRKKINSKENFIRLNLNSIDKKENNFIENNNTYKPTSKKYETYSVDSFRNEIEKDNDLLNELINAENDEIINNTKSLNIKIENIDNFFIASNKKIMRTFIIKDIDDILLNIKKKQKSLYQTQKMLNLGIENKQ